MLKSVLFLIFCAVLNAHAITEFYNFDSKIDSQRFDNLVHILRCPTCPNQSIYDSNSLSSEAILDEVFNMIKTGYTDDAIIDNLVSKYKEYILYKPKYNKVGVWLWIFPLFIILIGLLILMKNSMKFKRHNK